MARSHQQNLPKYRLHKRSGLAVVTLSGRDVYLGRHDTEESRSAYERVVGDEVLAFLTGVSAMITNDWYAEASGRDRSQIASCEDRSRRCTYRLGRIDMRTRDRHMSLSRSQLVER